MELTKMKQILSDTAYVRTGGSPEEKRCAEYIRSVCGELGLDARLEEFSVPMATIRRAELFPQQRHQHHLSHE